MQNPPHLPLPGAEQEPDIAHAIENALQHLILWSQAEKARIQCHLNLQRHKPERRCAICISWPSGSPTFPNDRDRFLKRLLTEEGLPFIRQHFTAPETVHEIILLCLWRSWMLHGQRILAVDLEDVARLPTIAAGSTFPDPEPSAPILFAIKNGTNRPQLVFVEDGRGLDRTVHLSRITEGAYGASMAKGPTTGTPSPRRFVALSIRPPCLDDPSPAVAQDIKRILDADPNTRPPKRSSPPIPPIELVHKRCIIESGRTVGEQPALSGTELNPFQLVRIVNCLDPSLVGPGISRLRNIAPELARLFRTGPSFRPVPKRFRTAGGPSLFAVAGPADS